MPPKGIPLEFRSCTCPECEKAWRVGPSGTEAQRFCYDCEVAGCTRELARCRRPLFPLGMLVGTPGAFAAVFRAGHGVAEFIARHERGDWGAVGDEDKAANDRAVRGGERILSDYHLRDGTRLWIVSEADRSSTCLLLPDEY